MKNKIIFLIILLFSFYNVYSQTIKKYDTILVENCYKSYYNYKIKAPTYVIYKLYKGGGNESRTSLSFRTKLPHFNYTKSGYERGHLCNAEDMAFDRDLLKATFWYHNVIPQTKQLNRGSWKSIETVIRKYSQFDSVLVICGGCDYKGEIPRRCFKIVYSLTSKKCLISYIFNNDNFALYENTDKLKKRFTFNKIMKLYQEK